MIFLNKARNFRNWFLFVLLIVIIFYSHNFSYCSGSIGFNKNRENGMAQNNKKENNKLSENEILKIANSELEKRGLEPKAYKAKIQKKELLWEIEFYPVQTSGSIVMGGGLQIFLEENGTVNKVIRNQ